MNASLTFRPVAAYTAVQIILLVAFILLTGIFPDFETAFLTAGLSINLLIGLAILGALGIWLSARTGFPDALDPAVSNRQRFLFPVILGAAAGLALLALLPSQAGSTTQVGFPASLLIYFYLAIYTEIEYRLFPLPLIVWFFSSLLFRDRFQSRVFWITAILLSAIEPLVQVVETNLLGLLGPSPALLTVVIFLLLYAVNLTSAFVFRRAGILSSIALRFALLLIWRVLPGALA